MSNSLPQFDTSTFYGQLFWLTITYGFLFIWLQFVIIPRFKKILNKRNSEIANCDLKITKIDRFNKSIENEIKDILDLAKKEAHDMIRQNKIKSEDEIKKKNHIAQNNFLLKMNKFEEDLKLKSEDFQEHYQLKKEKLVESFLKLVIN